MSYEIDMPLNYFSNIQITITNIQITNSNYNNVLRKYFKLYDVILEF